MIPPVSTGCSSGAASSAAADASIDGTHDAAWPLDVHDDGTHDAAWPLDVHDDTAEETGEGPAIANLMLEANPNNLLSGTLTFTTDQPTTDQVQVVNLEDGGASNSFSIPLAGMTPTTFHRIPVLGLRASSRFRIDVETTSAVSRKATASLAYTTGALPPAIPPISVVTNDKTRTSPGYTMMDLWLWDATQPFATPDPSRSSVIIVDADGEVVWYAMSPACCTPTDARKLPNGDITFLGWGRNSGQAVWEEIDMMGNVVFDVSANEMGLDFISHEIFPEPGTENFLSLTPQLRSIPGYPTADGGTTTYAVVGDAVVEVGADASVIHEWSTFDMFDPHYEGTRSEFNFPTWNFLYADAGKPKDWTHGNSVVVDPASNDIVASSRTLSWIFKFDRNDGGPPRLLWRLGPGGDFALTNANDGFQYNQHCATVLPNGNIMAFDDGDGRPNDAGFAGLYSRAVEFSLDTTKMQATIVWQYRESPPFYSPYVGSSYLLPNGNVLVDDGADLADHLGQTDDPTNLKYARIMEVTHDPVPTKVMEFDVNPPLTWQANFSGFWVYRAKRIPSLY